MNYLFRVAVAAILWGIPLIAITGLSTDMRALTMAIVVAGAFAGGDSK